jgi:hypothetical protein
VKPFISGNISSVSPEVIVEIDETYLAVIMSPLTSPMGERATPTKKEKKVACLKRERAILCMCILTYKACIVSMQISFFGGLVTRKVQ